VLAAPKRKKEKVGNPATTHQMGLLESLANVVSLPRSPSMVIAPKGSRFGGLLLQTRERGCRTLPDVRITLLLLDEIL